MTAQQIETKATTTSMKNQLSSTNPVLPTQPIVHAQATRVVAQPSLTKLPPNDLYRRLLPAVLFVLTFVSVMTLLLMYMDTTALLAQQFRKNMTRDYELNRIAQDNPTLVSFIRELHLGVGSTGGLHHHHHNHDGHNHVTDMNAQQPLDEKLKLILSLTENKTNGTFMEILIRGGRDNITYWLQQNKGWNGLVVRADPQDYLMLRSDSQPTLQACLSSTIHPKEVTYYESLKEWSEDGVSVNAVMPGSTDIEGSGFNSRVMCFPLYTLMLVVNYTKCDYMIISSPGNQLAVLETLPFDKVDIKVLELRMADSAHRNATTKYLLDRRYKVKARYDDIIIYTKINENSKM